MTRAVGEVHERRGRYRTLRAGGPALLFENPKGSDIPLLGNLFGTPKRVALGMGEESVEALREAGVPMAGIVEMIPSGSTDNAPPLPKPTGNRCTRSGGSVMGCTASSS